MKELIFVNKRLSELLYHMIDWNSNSLPTALELMTHKTDAIKSDLRVLRATRRDAELPIHTVQWNLAGT